MSSRTTVATKCGDPRHTAGAVVLIVDDNECIRRLFAEILQSEGYQTVEARTGVEAIEKTILVNPNLVLIDLSLPDMTGTDVARAINESSSGRIPMIGCSAYWSSRYKATALQSGMVDYLIKPVSVDIFKATVAKYLIQGIIQVL
jgi:two-component system cell cycle response regulator DivK